MVWRHVLVNWKQCNSAPQPNSICFSLHLYAIDYKGSGIADSYKEQYGGTTMTYTVLPILRTSFTGKDMLEIWMQASNIGQGEPSYTGGANNPSCAAGYGGTASAYCIPGLKDNTLSIYRIF